MTPPVSDPKGPADAAPMKLDPGTARRMGRATLDYERRYHNPKPPPGRPPRSPGGGVAIAKTTTIITAASGSTLGSGSIQIETGSGASIADPGGTPPTYTAYSNDSQEVDSGAYVVVAPFRDGYILLHARCGDLS